MSNIIKLERREAVGQIELRANKEGDMPTVELRFPLEQYSTPIMGVFDELITRAAFDDDLKEITSKRSSDNPRIIGVDLNHVGEAVPLARWHQDRDNNTLEITRSGDWLIGRFQLPKSAESVREGIERGDLDGVSIAYRCLEDARVEGRGKLPLRRVLRASLHAFTITHKPYYPASGLSNRAILDKEMSEQDYRDLITRSSIDVKAALQAQQREHDLRMLQLTRPQERA